MRDRACLFMKDRRIEQSNQRANELLQVRDPVGLRLFELLVPESWNDVRIAVEQVARGERKSEASLARLRNDDLWLKVTVHEAGLFERRVHDL